MTPKTLNHAITKGLVEVFTIPMSALEILNHNGKAVNIMKDHLDLYFMTKFKEYTAKHPDHSGIYNLYLEIFKE